MSLHEWHPFNRAEISRIPAKPGLYVLFQLQIPIEAASTDDLRLGLRAARRKFPRVTHFSAELVPRTEIPKRLKKLTVEMGLVRAVGFGAKTRRT